jgi:hypothetical protein
LVLQAMLWLQERNFDVVHFADWQGHGYYTLLAKHSRVAFAHTTLCLMVSRRLQKTTLTFA